MSYKYFYRLLWIIAIFMSLIKSTTIVFAQDVPIPTEEPTVETVESTTASTATLEPTEIPTTPTIEPSSTPILELTPTLPITGTASPNLDPPVNLPNQNLDYEKILSDFYRLDFWIVLLLTFVIGAFGGFIYELLSLNGNIEKAT